MESSRTKRIGILAHSAEGAALSFLAACHEGERRLGAHFHPDIVMDIEAMGASMMDWERMDLPPIARRLEKAAQRLVAAGADFFLCPDNTAHIALESMQSPLPLPGLHIAEVVVGEAKRQGFHGVGILGTRWTMEGPVYREAIKRAGLNSLSPLEEDRKIVHHIIFEQLVRGVILDESRDALTRIIDRLKERGCDSVALGCTELPLILDKRSSSLPALDSTRLQACAAVGVALGNIPMPEWRGGLPHASREGPRGMSRAYN